MLKKILAISIVSCSLQLSFSTILDQKIYQKEIALSEVEKLEADNYLLMANGSLQTHHLETLDRAAFKNYTPAVFKLYDYYSRKFNNDQFKAPPYLLQGARLNDYESLLILAEAHQERRPLRNIDTTVSEGNRIYRELITEYPDRSAPKLKMLKGWTNDFTTLNLGGAKKQQALLALVTSLEIAQDLDIEEEKDNYLLQGLFYRTKGPYQDFKKAYQAYDNLIKLGEKYDNAYFPEFARYQQALLLKEGDESLPKNEKKALKMLLVVSEKLDINQIYNHLAPMFHYGLGTEVDLDKAIEYYWKGDKSDSDVLGLILLEKADLKSQKQGARLIADYIEDHQDRSDLKEKLLQYPHLFPVQKWVYRTFTYSNYYDDINAYAYLKKNAQAGVIEAQFYWAQVLLKAKFKEENQEGARLLNALIDKSYQPALEFKLGESHSQFEKKALMDILQLTLTSNKDKKSYANSYARWNYYQDAIQLYRQLGDSEPYLEEVYIAPLIKKQADLELLISQGQTDDMSAISALIEFYKKQNNTTEYEKWLNKGSHLGNSGIQKEYALFLLARPMMNADIQKQVIDLFVASIENKSEENLDAFQQALFNNQLSISDDAFLNIIQPLFPAQYQALMAARVAINERDALLAASDAGSEITLATLKQLLTDYSEGAFVRKDSDKTLTVLKKMALLKDRESADKIGDIYTRQYLNEQEDQYLKEAAYWYQMAKDTDYTDESSILELYALQAEYIKTGDMALEFEIGKFYEGNNLFRESFYYNQKGWKMIEAAAEKGFVAAQMYLADYRYSGRYVQDIRDNEKIEFWLNRAIALDSHEARYKLATHLLQKYYYTNHTDDRDQAMGLLAEIIHSETNNGASVYRDAFFSLSKRYVDAGKLEQLEALYDNLKDRYDKGFSRRALDELAQAYAKDRKEGSNYKQALKFSTLLYELDQDEAYTIAYYYLNGDTTLPKDEAKAIEWYQKLYQRVLVRPEDHFSRKSYSYENDINKMAGFVARVLRGTHGFQKTDQHERLAEKWLQEIASLGGMEASKVLYEYYLDKNRYAAAYIYGKLVDASDLNKIAALFSEQEVNSFKVTIEEISKDLTFAPYRAEFNYLVKNSQEKGAHSVYVLGLAYLEGEIIPVDVSKGITYLEQAGSAGYGRAYNVLGNMYRQGEKGVVKDMQKALYYFDLGATKAMDSNTAHQAGDLLYFGEGGLPKDHTKAVEYFEMTDLSRQGKRHFSSKYKAAYILYHGLGNAAVDKQRAKALLESVRSFNNIDVNEALDTWDFKE